MESQMVRRRMNTIAAHLGSNEDISATATHLFPMSCSNSLNSVIRRYDNRTYFARQGSASHGYFMRQVSRDKDTSMQPFVSATNGNKEPNAVEAPMFSKPAQSEPAIPSRKEIRSPGQGYAYNYASPEAPTFARPHRNCGSPQILSQDRTKSPETINGFEWSPRMDVAESGFTYTVTLEIPGVSCDNVKVEVNNQSLIVTGNRSNWSCGASSCSNKSTVSYLKKDIFPGPYRIVWPLPNNANKENVSAEIQDGLLQINIPKLSVLRWLRKAHM